ncbi:inositol monophosphatase family protein [Variovorax sp. AFSI2.2]|uniref:inositol monophosphatase family protein n=1 Tax=Variovorax sp. AFSI2.2 TaxID=3384160 RepID=UPI003EC0EE72
MEETNSMLELSSGVSMPPRLALAHGIVESAAATALHSFTHRRDVSMRTKQPQDFVSAVDETVERYIREQLSRTHPGEPVYGEEFGDGERASGALAESTWVVDPIDGTTNFLRGIPLWGVSLGFISEGRATMGVIAMPALGLIVGAQRGAGLFVNGLPATRETAFDAVRVVSVGDAHSDIDRAAATTIALRRAGWVVESYRSTATAMAFAAIGYLDGHMQHSVKIWDMAGGLALCEEAGLLARHAPLSDCDGFVMVGTPEVMEVIEPLT